MKLKLATLALAGAMTAAVPAMADLVFPSLSYRTGPYAANGIPFADGYADYFTLLNEPSMGLAPQLVEEIFTIVKNLNEKEGVSFLLAEQNTNVALRFAHYGYILESGRVVMDGPAAELRENPDVKEFYLGVSDEGRKSFRDVRSYRRRKRWLS